MSVFNFIFINTVCFRLSRI